MIYKSLLRFLSVLLLKVYKYIRTKIDVKVEDPVYTTVYEVPGGTDCKVAWIPPGVEVPRDKQELRRKLDSKELGTLLTTVNTFSFLSEKLELKKLTRGGPSTSTEIDTVVELGTLVYSKPEDLSSCSRCFKEDGGTLVLYAMDLVLVLSNLHLEQYKFGVGTDDMIIEEHFILTGVSNDWCFFDK